MQLPKRQTIFQDDDADNSRERWLNQAGFSLYQAARAQYPDRFPLPWDLVPTKVRDDFRYLAMAAYRRTLPLVDKVLVEMVAMNLANLDGYIYPDCDNRRVPGVAEDERPAVAAQRRQAYRHKARQIISSIGQYLEHDSDTEAQRKQTVERVERQLQADRMVASQFRASKGIPVDINRG